MLLPIGTSTWVLLLSQQLILCREFRSMHALWINLARLSIPTSLSLACTLSVSQCFLTWDRSSRTFITITTYICFWIVLFLEIAISHKLSQNPILVICEPINKFWIWLRHTRWFSQWSKVFLFYLHARMQKLPL